MLNNLVRRLELHRPLRPRTLAPPPSGGKRWTVRIGIAALAVWLIYLFIFSNQGIVKILGLRHELGALQHRSQLASERVKRAEEELYRVRHDPFYTEKYVRENTGMVKPDEIVYRVVPESVAQQALEVRALAPAPLPGKHQVAFGAGPDATPGQLTGRTGASKALTAQPGAPALAPGASAATGTSAAGSARVAGGGAISTRPSP